MSLPLVRAAAVATALLATATAASAHDYWVFFGTYTGGKSVSKGIYRSKMDAHTGKLTEPELAAEMGSPSFLAVHPNGKFLYAVGEGGGKEGGPVVAFALDGKTGSLAKLNEGLSGGSGPCHISVSPDGRSAVVANYGGGSSAFFRVAEDGKLGDRTFFQHQGSGPSKGRQQGPHGHCGQFTPDGRTALVVDLGIDRVKVFRLDAAGKVSNDEAKDIPTPPGAGPRHIAVAPDGKFAYVCGELDSTVNVIQLDPAGGTGKVVQTLSTLPMAVKGNSTAECILHPSGKFVYVSNRGHNSIAVFAVGPDRKLTAAGHITGDIRTPRNFNVDPSGRWMLIASQDGDKVGVWEIDPNAGTGKETGTAVKVGRPVCVKFVAVGK
jgi:6-phosphogluconolactonase